MGKASRTKQAPDRRARVAAQREAARRAEQRKRIYLAGGSILAVIIVVVAFVIIKSNGSGSGSGIVGSNGPTGTALTSVVNQTTSVPAATLDAVGSGSGQVTATPITLKGSQPPLTSGGKPVMLYMGGEYCPYCAAERWSMVVALSRFGTFSGLATTHSAPATASRPEHQHLDVPQRQLHQQVPGVPARRAEHQHPGPSNGFYTTLQTPTKAQEALITKYDNATYYPPLALAWLDPVHRLRQQVHDRRRQLQPAGAGGKTWAQIAAALKTPSSTIAQAVDGTANYITAAICKMTGNQPASACTSAVTVAREEPLRHASGQAVTDCKLTSD